MDIKEHAESTVRFAVCMAIASTADVTGLRAGQATDNLIKAIMNELKSPSLVWALREWANRDETEKPPSSN